MCQNKSFSKKTMVLFECSQLMPLKCLFAAFKDSSRCKKYLLQSQEQFHNHENLEIIDVFFIKCSWRLITCIALFPIAHNFFLCFECWQVTNSKLITYRKCTAFSVTTFYSLQSCKKHSCIECACTRSFSHDLRIDFNISCAIAIQITCPTARHLIYLESKFSTIRHLGSWTCIYIM